MTEPTFDRDAWVAHERERSDASLRGIVYALGISIALWVGAGVIITAILAARSCAVHANAVRPAGR